MIGSQRPFASLLIQPADSIPALKTDTQGEELLDKIWPVIDASNKTAPSNGQIEREHVIFTRDGEELPMTDKQVAKRNVALALYEKEIDELYIKFEEVMTWRDLNKRDQ